MARFAQGLAPADNWDELKQQAPGILRHTVAAMIKLLSGQDAFDVLDLVRQHEVPITLEGYRESEAEGLAAVIDVVALVTIGLGSRQISLAEGDIRDQLPPPNKIIEPLCVEARRIVQLAMMLGIAMEEQPGSGSLAELAGQLRSAELMIRGKQYESIAAVLNKGVLDVPHVERILEDVFGFSYRDVQIVATAIRERYQDVKTGLRDRMMELVEVHESGTEPDPDVLDEARRVFSDFLVSPGQSSSFAAAEIANKSGLAADRVESILQTFSVQLVSTGDAGEPVRSFVNGRNPLYGIDLLADADGHYLMLQNGISSDQIRRNLESKIKLSGNQVWARYGRHRDQFAESFTCQQVSTLLAVDDATFKSLKYLAPPTDEVECDLSSEAHDPKQYAKIVEADALYVVDDVAICVEVKAGSITDKAKSGNVQRMVEDLRKTVGSATAQAQRLESLILENHGLWLEDGSWLNLSAVREVHSVVACLDDFGPLAIAADALIRANLLTGSSIPWIVSLHDLAVTAKVLTTPASFLLYLRRRTEPSAARLFVATDELDLLMWFVRGGLYFEADPDTLFQRHPQSPPPTGNDRARFRRETSTRVGTLTDDLDAWMYYEEGRSQFEAKRPTRVENREIAKLIAFLQDGRKPGWLRFGADLLNLSSSAQKGVVGAIKQVVKSTRQDHEFHSSVQGFVGPWGYPVLFVGSQPRGYAGAAQRLSTYMAAKKYQLQADRALGILITEASEIVSIVYQNHPYRQDGELDQLVDELRLVPPQRMTRSAAPRQQRKASKKRKKRRNRKRG